MSQCPRCGAASSTAPCQACGAIFEADVATTVCEQNDHTAQEQLIAAITPVISLHQRPNAALESLQGQVSLGGYRFDQALAKGGMGSLWKATRLSDNNPVVIKTPLWSDQDAQLRFTREARALSTCRHQNIVKLRDIDMTADHQALLIMDYVPGQTLRDRLSQQPLAAAEFEQIGQQIAKALDHCHRRGIIHRDIKPENIIVHGDQITLIDFSLALIDQLQAPQQINNTPHGYILGTPPYAAPEQLRQPSQINTQADLYSFGILLDECLHHTSIKGFEQRRLKQWQQLIHSCCHYHPDQRPKLDNILHFCYLYKVKCKNEIKKQPKKASFQFAHKLSVVLSVIILAACCSFIVTSLMPDDEFKKIQGFINPQEADTLHLNHHDWDEIIIKAQDNTQIRLPGSGNWRQEIRVSHHSHEKLPLRIRDPDGHWSLILHRP